MADSASAQRSLDALSNLAFGWNAYAGFSTDSGSSDEADLRYVASLGPLELLELLRLAEAHHVVVRAFSRLQRVAFLHADQKVQGWCEESLIREHARIDAAVRMLKPVCQALETNGCACVVIKSLDHWPDLGSDLDLYTRAPQPLVEYVLRNEFNAEPIERSWGDRLAHKWNFRVPGLAELIEIHFRYLGQTGEHEALARSVIERSITKEVGGLIFRVAASEQQIVISTLQRMYRHFYFRLCDMVDVAVLLREQRVDFGLLQRTAEEAGIWPGVAAFLVLVAKYATAHGFPVELPDNVVSAAHATRLHVWLENGFLRIPRLLAAQLYRSQIFDAGKKGNMRAMLRLPLLPPLAISAVLAYRLTGSNKGIW